MHASGTRRRASRSRFRAFPFSDTGIDACQCGIEPKPPNLKFNEVLRLGTSGPGQILQFAGGYYPPRASKRLALLPGPGSCFPCTREIPFKSGILGWQSFLGWQS